MKLNATKLLAWLLLGSLLDKIGSYLGCSTKIISFLQHRYLASGSVNIWIWFGYILAKFDRFYHDGFIGYLFIATQYIIETQTKFCTVGMIMKRIGSGHALELQEND